MVTANPFLFVVSLIVVGVNHLLFQLRVRMKASKQNLMFNEVQIAHVTMFTQNAWMVFAWIFVPTSQAFAYFFLLPL